MQEIDICFEDIKQSLLAEIGLSYLRTERSARSQEEWLKLAENSLESSLNLQREAARARISRLIEDKITDIYHKKGLIASLCAIFRLYGVTRKSKRFLKKFPMLGAQACDEASKIPYGVLKLEAQYGYPTVENLIVDYHERLINSI